VDILVQVVDILVQVVDILVQVVDILVQIADILVHPCMVTMLEGNMKIVMIMKVVKREELVAEEEVNVVGLMIIHQVMAVMLLLSKEVDDVEKVIRNIIKVANIK
jgi:hypothetical protein